MKTYIQPNSFSPIKTLDWLFFDLNSYFASVEQQDNPELMGRPVAVVPSMTDYTCAIAASYEAKAYGVKTGTRILEAKQMCPDLICVQARHDVYVDYHHKIFAELENHLHVTKVCSVDEAACMLLGDEREPENARAIAERIKESLRENIGPAIRCSIGVGPNIFLAKMGTELQKPDGFAIIDPTNIPEQMFKLKLTDLTGINVRMEQRLNRPGVHTVEQFWNLSPKHARKVWGSIEGERFWFKLHGYDVPEPKTKKRVVGHSRVLDPKLRDTESAYAFAVKLTEKAATRLRGYSLYGKRLCLRVRSTDKMYWEDYKVFAPTQDNFAFLRQLRDMWRDMLVELQPQRIMKVAVTIFDLYERQEITPDLFETLEKEQDDKLSQAMDTLNIKFGASTVSVGSCPKTTAGFVGTKIAFTRVPDKNEFSQ